MAIIISVIAKMLFFFLSWEQISYFCLVLFWCLTQIPSIVRVSFSSAIFIVQENFHYINGNKSKHQASLTTLRSQWVMLFLALFSPPLDKYINIFILLGIFFQFIFCYRADIVKGFPVYSFSFLIAFGITGYGRRNFQNCPSKTSALISGICEYSIITLIILFYRAQFTLKQKDYLPGHPMQLRCN